MTSKGFTPYFWTQFLGAFNDNFYKIACTMLVTYRIAGVGREEVSSLVALAAGLFILPFFLFSATAGQLADRFDKAALIRWIKFMEIVVMGGAVCGFVLNSIPILLVIIFCMGAQSAFFGPVKYSVIPELLPEERLIRGNGLVESSTFISILTGTILGGFSIALSGDGFFEIQQRLIATATGLQRSIVSSSALVITCSGVMLLALAGFLFSLGIPKLGARSPELKIRWNIASLTLHSLRHIRQGRLIFWSIISISFFWFYGALLLQIIPGFARFYLGGGETVFTLCLVMFSVGIGAGSFLCSILSAGHVRPYVMSYGLIGLVLAPLLTLMFGRWIPGVMFSLLLIGVSGGMYIVPLYATVQDRCPHQKLSRTIAAGCILDALFMVVASVILKTVTGNGLTERMLLPVLGGITLFFGMVIMIRVRDFRRKRIIPE